MRLQESAENSARQGSNHILSDIDNTSYRTGYGSTSAVPVAKNAPHFHWTDPPLGINGQDCGQVLSHVLATLALVSARPWQKALKRVPCQDMGQKSTFPGLRLCLVAT